jgi:glycosyltransferase involved in cell wall biosynthesis
MESSPFFSVVIPAYNCSGYLQECVQGVQDQTFPNWEVIIIDDGSKDDSYAIAREFGKTDPRIRVIQHLGAVNRGVSASRNLGVKYAQGEWIAFLDADDVWKPHFLERYFRVIFEHPDLVFLYSKAYFIDSRGGLITDSANNADLYGAGIGGYDQMAFERSFSGDFQVPTSSVVAPKKAICEVRGFEEALTIQVEDTLLWHQLIERGPVYFINDVLLGYRVHDTQWTARANDKTRTGRRLVVYRYLIEKCQSENKRLVSFYYVNHGLRNIVRGYLLFPAIDWSFVFRSLAEVLTSKHIFFLHKLAAIGMIPYEIIIVPLRIVKRVWTRVFFRQSL